MVTVADGTLLDREVVASHDITVRATSSDGSFNTAVITINVNDVDEFDIGPISDTDASADEVAENSAVGTAVGVTAFAEDLEFDLGDKALRLEDIWINILPEGGIHTGHIHPHSVISGTTYVAMPDGASAIKFEDPRLPMMIGVPVKPIRAQLGRARIRASWLRTTLSSSAVWASSASCSAPPSRWWTRPVS